MGDPHDTTGPIPTLDDLEPQHIRELVAMAGQARRDGWPVETVRQALALYAAAMADTPAPLTPAPAQLGDVLDDLQRRIDHYRATGLPLMGWLTGLATLDDRLGGLQAARLTILIAQPGQGKTTLAAQIAYHVATQGAPVLYLSYENSAASLILRTIARIGGRSVRAVERGEFPLDRLAPAVETFRRDGQSLYFLDGGRQTTLDALEGYVAELTNRHPDAGPPLIVTDYLQRLAATDATERDARMRVERTSQRLSELAKRTPAHILAISSTNRAAYQTKDSRPSLSSARESGAIEFDADHVLALARPEGDDGPAPHGVERLCLEIAKNRHGAMGTVPLHRDWLTLAISEPELAAAGPGASWAAGRNGRASGAAQFVAAARR